jgi:hypothetical protein
MSANTNSEWWGLMRNKLAVTTLLGGYGFAVIPMRRLGRDLGRACFPVGRLRGIDGGSPDFPISRSCVASGPVAGFAKKTGPPEPALEAAW